MKGKGKIVLLIAMLSMIGTVNATENRIDGRLQQNKIIYTQVNRENALMLLATTNEASVIKTWNISATSADNVTGTLYDDGTLVISGKGNMVDAYFQDGVVWTSYRNNIKKIIIENGVTSIGNFAFYKCTNLESVEMPEMMKRIGYYAFRECATLKNITIPKGIKSIPKSCFDGCSSLINVYIPEGVEAIEIFAFSECIKLESINIPAGVEAIGSSAFNGCASLTSISIPVGVTFLGDYCFQGCTSLKNIKIPQGVTAIQNFTFNKCSNLTSIELPNDLKTIGTASFQLCSKLSNINIPNGVTSIGEKAFYGCSSLENINIPEGITKIETALFYECISLKNINIPQEVTIISDSAFNKCKNLISIEIPTQVTQIGEYAFLDNYNLSEVIVYCNSYAESFMRENYEYNLSVQHYYRVEKHLSNCTEGGYTKYTCTGCNYSYTTNQTSPLGHSYSEDWTVDVESTCKNEGSKSRHCLNKDCNSKIDIEILDTISHDYGFWITKKEPTCEEDGLREKVCNVCGDVLSQEIYALRHDYFIEWTIDIEPTCKEEGSKSRHCLRENCDSKIDITPIEIIPHKYGEWIITKESTYEEEGKKHRICRICNEQREEESIPKLQEEEVQVSTTYTLKESGNVKFIFIEANTEVGKLLFNIEANKKLKVIDKSGKELKIDEFVGTGAKVIVDENNKEVYTVVLQADVNCDGKITFKDIITANAVRLNNNENISKALFLAADIDCSDKITFIDIIKINSIRINSL